MSVDDIKTKYNEYEDTVDKTLPKVDKRLVLELLHYMKKDPSPMYTIEVFLKEKPNTEELRNIVINELGVMPAFYDHDTHLVVAHRITPELLKRINDQPDVLQIRGTYTGGGRASIGPVYEYGDDEQYYSKKG